MSQKQIAQLNRISNLLSDIEEGCKRLEDKLDEASKTKDISRNKDRKRRENIFQRFVRLWHRIRH